MPKIMGNSLAEHRERTRTALFDALSELMNRHSFDKITLSDVAAHRGLQPLRRQGGPPSGIHGA